MLHNVFTICPAWINFVGSQFVFAGYSGEPFSNWAFNLRLRAACRAMGRGDHSPLVAAGPFSGPQRRMGDVFRRRYPDFRQQQSMKAPA
jgi:hypothetical protein